MYRAVFHIILRWQTFDSIMSIVERLKYSVEPFFQVNITLINQKFGKQIYTSNNLSLYYVKYYFYFSLYHQPMKS